MRFKLDENLPAELLTDLRVAGHDAETVPDEGITGAPDSMDGSRKLPGSGLGGRHVTPGALT
jgi:hypothetical protein